MKFCLNLKGYKMNPGLILKIFIVLLSYNMLVNCILSLNLKFTNTLYADEQDKAQDNEQIINDHYIKIMSLLKNNKFRQAEDLLLTFNHRYPDPRDYRFHFFIGIIEENKGNTIEAIDNFRKAIEIYPEYSTARNKLGSLYMSFDQYNLAEEQYMKAIELNPYNPFIHYNLGSLYLTVKNYDKAEIYLKNACKYKKNLALSYFKLGIVMYYKNNFQESINNLKNALEFNYNSYLLYYYLGLSLNKAGNIKESITNLQKAIKLEDNFIEGIIAIGQVYQSNGDYSAAIKKYHMAESYYTHKINLRMYIAECYEGLGRYEDSSDILENLDIQSGDKNIIILNEQIENRLKKDINIPLSFPDY